MVEMRCYTSSFHQGFVCFRKIVGHSLMCKLNNRGSSFSTFKDLQKSTSRWNTHQHHLTRNCGQPICISINQSINQSITQSVSQSINQSIYLSIYLSTYVRTYVRTYVCMSCVYIQTQLFNLASKKKCMKKNAFIPWFLSHIQQRKNRPPKRGGEFCSLAHGPMNPIPSGEKFTHDIATEVIVQHRQTHEGQEDQAWTQQAELRNKQNKVNMLQKMWTCDQTRELSWCHELPFPSYRASIMVSTHCVALTCEHIHIEDPNQETHGTQILSGWGGRILMGWRDEWLAHMSPSFLDLSSSWETWSFHWMYALGLGLVAADHPFQPNPPDIKLSNYRTQAVRILENVSFS